MPSKTDQQGISLIEVLVSVAILSIGLLGLSGFTGNLYRSVNHAGDRSKALAIAQRYIENARTKGAATLTSGAVTTPSDCSTSAFYTYWKANDIAGSNGVKHYSVNVCWTNALGEKQLLTTSTYIGTGSTSLGLGAPVSTPAPTKCVGIPYVDKTPAYSAGQVVTLNSKDYTCVTGPNSGFCGQAGFKPGTLYGAMAWGDGVTCVP
ncbi:prepilin-type N-terminal cleavage/methylation domain-containing protein [Chitinibacter bivalviorum]|uniref:Prepilin-type N-terminal cleavage/methylation domain-containing protein n=1 Tax=Chitinibacter bivalviorum TaxID=2739434 RepID=A0A7H9BGD9_9NEIS|nr:prepilin-type N-terminal cleavage/methylation domain-containing protein [Chitinibacter bivalviorum]QLG87326.1 prepilin-type N-terminal cleavage/methylation domain-containing protein [Chitinibacter bivalviorum]